MKTLLFAFIFLSACSHVRIPPAHFEPSVTPADRSISSSGGLSPVEIDALWQRPNDRRDSLIRSNPTHYWAWMKANSPSNLEDIISLDGMVIADAHYFNFGDVHKEGKPGGLAVVDVDDSGKGSLFLDFIRYSIFVKAYLKNDFTKELFDAYTDGLAGKEKKVPDFLAEPLSKSRKQLEEANDKWVRAKLNSKNELDNKALKLTSYKDLKKNKPEVAKLGEELEKGLLQAKKFEAIYDHGYMVTDSGSSSNMHRFWYSVKVPQGSVRIVECKQFGDPATGYYAKQSQHSKRITDVLKIYSDVETDDSFVFNSPNLSYWCRPRHFSFFDRDEVEEDRAQIKDMVTYSRYLAFWMGRKQKLQPNGEKLLTAIKIDSKKTLEAAISLINTYDANIDALGGKSHKNLNDVKKGK